MNFDFVFLAPDPNPGFYFTPALPSQMGPDPGKPVASPTSSLSKASGCPKVGPQTPRLLRTSPVFQETHENTPFVLLQHTAQSQGDPRLLETMNTCISEPLGQR